MKNVYANSIGLIFCGLGLGWLVGMSTNPTIQNIITTLFTFLMTILGLIAGINLNQNTKLGEYINQINLLPIGLFIFFLSLGSAGGVYSRTNDILGMNPKSYMEKWQIPKTKIDSLRNEFLRDSIKKATLFKGKVNGDSELFEKKKN